MGRRKKIKKMKQMKTITALKEGRRMARNRMDMAPTIPFVGARGEVALREEERVSIYLIQLVCLKV
jgi:hypothetical protein